MNDMTDQLPDGVERDRDVDEYTGRDLRLYTTVEGHGRVREKWRVTTTEDDYWFDDSVAALAFADNNRSKAVRVIVIECDAAPAKE